jgi:hypothetical protein
MKKVALTAIAIVWFTGFSFAAETEDELTQLSQWLAKYYCQQNNVEWIEPGDPRSAEMKQKGEGIYSLPPLTLTNDMYNKIKQEFPMPAEIQAALTAIDNKKAADYLILAQKYGYSSWENLANNMKKDPQFNSGTCPIWNEMAAIDQSYNTARSNTGNAYWTEFHQRYETAVIEAIKRIQENANAMTLKK